MLQYIFILVWLGFMGGIASQMQLKRLEFVCGERVMRYPWWFSLFVFFPIIWMAATRGYFGDTFMYQITYLKMPDSFLEFAEYLKSVEKDKGYSVFAFFVKQIVGNNTVCYFAVVAFVQAVLLITVFRKYTPYYIMVVFLFVASTDYLSWMFNGIRQFMAVTIVFSATIFMLKKKYLPLLGVILLASSFHKTALLMIPCVLIAQGNAWNKKTLVFIAVILLSVAFIGTFTSLLDSALKETQYVNVVSDYKSWNDDGTSFLRVVFYSIPAILSFIWRKKIQKVRNPLVNFCTNMSIISMGLYVISMFTSGVFIGRLPIYVSLYGYILLAWEVHHCFRKEMIQFAIGGLIVVYSLFYYVQMKVWEMF